MIWYATSERAYEVACIEPESGAVLLSFGKHRGERLADVPDDYLGWMLSGSGRAFLPDDFLEIVKAEVRSRRPPVVDPPTVSWPDSRDTTSLVGFASEAPAADVSDYLRHLDETIRWMVRVLDTRAGDVVGEQVEAAIRQEEQTP